jgi:hypothetical protein
MKSLRLCLLLALGPLAFAPSLHAQARGNPRALLIRALTRAPLNTATTITRPTPVGEVTVTTENTFNGSSGTFSTEVTLPNGNTTGVEGTITTTPGTGVTVSGTLTGPGGQSTDFTNSATPSAGGLTITSTVTPPSGNTVTHTVTLPQPDNPEEEDSALIRILKRLRLPLPPRN